jgi:hypothetical protein
VYERAYKVEARGVYYRLRGMQQANKDAHKQS